VAGVHIAKATQELQGQEGKQVFNEFLSCLAASVSLDGKPNVS